MRYCPACGHENPDDVASCLNCAEPLGQSCRDCGHWVPAGNKFCGYCGARLSEGSSSPTDSLWQDRVLHNLRAMMPTTLVEKINAASIQVLSERRQVTVLFLDIVNFTVVAHRMDSEDAFVLIDEAMRLLIQVIYKYEGTIDKFTGDGLMALFGAPLAHENDPERAVRAALEMQTVLQPLQNRVKQEHGFDLLVRTGINTGSVVAGKLGSDLHMEYTVIGDTVNLAARLEVAAEPGTILVTQTTYERTRPLLKYEVLPPLDVKGLPQPIPVYRPVALQVKPGQIRGLPGLETPMVGRADALAQLASALAEVRQRRQTRLVLITGQAGLGKSRLIAEFRKRLAGSRISICQGTGLAYARSTPLWLVANLLRDMLQLAEADPARVQQEKLQVRLDQLGCANDQVLPYLTHLLGLEQADSEAAAHLRLLDASMLQQQTHAALRQVLLAPARLAPAILIFEDLHWADSASSAFLEYFIQAVDDAPLMLVLITRDSESETAAGSLVTAARKNQNRLVEIQLRPLSSSEGYLLVNQLLKQMTDEAQTIKAGIAARAEGNPLYTEEIVRMLIDQGGLTSEGETWQVAPQAFELLEQVPATLKGLILARFDGLPQALRRTLQEVAVLGRSFPAVLPQMMSSTSPETIAGHLQELQDRQFLIAQQLGAEQEYAFCHALIQEAVYDTLLRRDRQEIHERAARAIEQGAFWPPEQQTEVLAYHYAESTHPSKAVPYLMTAAENAARRYANEIVIQHCRRAIALMEGQPAGELPRAGIGLSQALKSARIRLVLGQALKFVGEFAEASRILSEAIQLLQSLEVKSSSLVPLLVESLRELADVRQREGALAEAITHLEAALDMLKETPAQEYSTLRRSLLDRLAWVRFRQGNLDEALAVASSATLGVDPEQTDDPTTLASLYNTLGGVSWQQGNLSEATAYVERSLNLYQSLRYSWGTAIAYTNLGVLFYARGMWSQAVESFERAYLLQCENGYLPGQAVPLKNLGLLRLALGDHAQAQKDLGASLEISRRLGDDFGIVCAQLGLTLLAVTQCRFQDAAMYLEIVMGLLAAAGEDEAIQAHWLLALIQAENGDLPAGLKSAEQALQMARESKNSEQEQECLRVLGTLCARAGEYSQAEALFRESISLSSQRNDAYQRGLALLALGQMCQGLAHPGNPDYVEWRAKALAALDKAAQELESLKAAHDLELAQAALHQLQVESDPD